MIKLSILIPTLADREVLVKKLLANLSSQTGIVNYLLFESVYQMREGRNDLIQILSLTDNKEMSIGEKRNKLLQAAGGECVCFIDDDDEVSENYISLLLEAVDSGCDCASLKGMYSVDGVDDGIFEHSLKYNEWSTTNNEIKYERYPTPLNMIKASIAKQFTFPDITHGEDHAWSKELHESGLLKTEYYIDEVIYFYRYFSKK